MAEVALKGVKKVYPGGVEAVHSATLTIRDKEFIVLVGPSGCGKSTTLRMIAGLEEISAGTISIGDRVVNDVPPKDRDIAMVFQNYALYPHMTVFNNMAFGLKLRRFPKPEIGQRVQTAGSTLGIVELLGRKPKALSGGQRQRVAVGRAIVRKPSAFLFDEPLSNLDAKLRVEMRVELNKLHKRLQTTMIYVTHDQIEAMTLGDRIVIMKDGWIHQVDSPLKLYDEPVNTFVATFLGGPPMNLVDGTIEETGSGLIFTDGDIHIEVRHDLAPKVRPYVNKPMKLGIRPEDIKSRLSRSAKATWSPVDSRVEVVEALGDESLVYLVTAKARFVSKFDPHDRVRPGQELSVLVNTDKIHLFDAATGINVVHPPTDPNTNPYESKSKTPEAEAVRT